MGCTGSFLVMKMSLPCDQDLKYYGICRTMMWMLYIIKGFNNFRVSPFYKSRFSLIDPPTHEHPSSKVCSNWCCSLSLQSLRFLSFLFFHLE